MSSRANAAPAIHAAQESDLADELRLNAAFVAQLSPLDSPALRRLSGIAARHCVARVDGAFAGFALALREGADYGSPNYRWFARRHARFLYVDRVVVEPAHQGRGVASALYRDLLDFAAASRAPLVACELDLEPPNVASARFHAKLGFREVGVLQHPHKRVSLQELRLAAHAEPAA